VFYGVADRGRVLAQPEDGAQPWSGPRVTMFRRGNEGGTLVKRIVAILAGLVLLMSLPAAVSGAKATRFTDHFIGISCDGPPSVSGGGFVFFSATVSDQFGPDAFVDYWTGGAPVGPPDLFRDFDQPVTATWNGSVLAGSIPLVTSNGVSAGSATFSATLTPTGDPFTFDDRFRDGNHWHQFTGGGQPLDPTGTLTVGTSTFSLDGCFAEDTTVTVFETNPKSFVAHFSNRNVDCQLTNASGDTGFLFMNLDEGDVFVDAGAFPGGGPNGTGAVGGGTLSGGVLDTSLELYDFQTGQPVAGTGSIHLEIVGSGEPFDFLLKYATGREVVSGTTLDLEGTLTIGSITFDLGACVGIDAHDKVIDTQPSGPKPGGKVPANDLPSGAKLLAIGAKTSVATKGASPDREASYECMVFDDGGQIFEIPVGHTVWYRVVGTGGPITVDTAGSDYDTVAAVYTADGSGGFDPVPGACVDDVPTDPVGRTLQAAVTWDSVLGTTYYVQIGGFPQSFPYGNLWVAVR
jgi:hypothetical protein